MQETESNHTHDLNLNLLIGCSMYHVHLPFHWSESHNQVQTQRSRGGDRSSHGAEREDVHIYLTLIHSTLMLYDQIIHKLMLSHNNLLNKTKNLVFFKSQDPIFP